MCRYVGKMFIVVHRKFIEMAFHERERERATSFKKLFRQLLGKYQEDVVENVIENGKKDNAKL